MREHSKTHNARERISNNAKERKMKLDVTMIEGYDNMTAEEKVAALEGFELKPDTSEVDNLKNLLSKRNSENAKLTKELRERMSEEEQRQADRKAEIEAKDARIAELEKKDKIATYTASYMSIGFTADDARKQAELLYDGDFGAVIANHKAHVDNISKQAIAEAITKNHLSAGEVPAKTEDNTALRKAMGLPT